MTETANKSAAPIRLSSRIKDKRVLVEDGDSQLLWTVDQVLTACRAYNRHVELADVTRQVRELWALLTEWLAARGDAVQSAHLQPANLGQLLFLVVQKAPQFNQELTDSLTELDMDVANDDRFKLIKMMVRLVPPCEQDQIEAMLSRG